MAQMQTPLGGFRATLALGWVALCVAGIVYARIAQVPAWAALPLILAFLLEYLFYLLPGFPALRARVADRFAPPQLALLLCVLAVLPYLASSVGTGGFHWYAFTRLAVLAAALAFWYVFQRAGIVADLSFLTLVAAVALSHFFQQVYLDPVPNLNSHILGRLMLIRHAALCILLVRGGVSINYGFWPAWRDWLIGSAYFLLFLPIGVGLALWLRVQVFQPFQKPAWKIALTFVGMLWVVALGEEFLFRGLLLQWFQDWTRKTQLALLISSILFGAVHLPFRAFPNWRFALIAAVAGWFYGRAYLKTGSIRAPMVAHALTNTAWRLLFN